MEERVTFATRRSVHKFLDAMRKARWWNFLLDFLFALFTCCHHIFVKCLVNDPSATREHNKSVLQSLNPGDLVQFPRRRMIILVYYHWGIYIGDNQVVHKIKKKEKDQDDIRMDNFFDVAADSRARKNNSLDEKFPALPANQIVENAKSAIGKSYYNIAFRNCEQFATYCRYGEHYSKQVEYVISTLGGVLCCTCFSWRKQKKSNINDNHGGKNKRQNNELSTKYVVNVSNTCNDGSGDLYKPNPEQQDNNMGPESEELNPEVNLDISKGIITEKPCLRHMKLYIRKLPQDICSTKHANQTTENTYQDDIVKKRTSSDNNRLLDIKAESNSRSCTDVLDNFNSLRDIVTSKQEKRDICLIKDVSKTIEKRPVRDIWFYLSRVEYVDYISIPPSPRLPRSWRLYMLKVSRITENKHNCRVCNKEISCFRPRHEDMSPINCTTISSITSPPRLPNSWLLSMFYVSETPENKHNCLVYNMEQPRHEDMTLTNCTTISSTIDWLLSMFCSTPPIPCTPEPSMQCLAPTMPWNSTSSMMCPLQNP